MNPFLREFFRVPVEPEHMRHLVAGFARGPRPRHRQGGRQAGRREEQVSLSFAESGVEVQRETIDRDRSVQNVGCRRLPAAQRRKRIGGDPGGETVLGPDLDVAPTILQAFDVCALFEPTIRRASLLRTGAVVFRSGRNNMRRLKRSLSGPRSLRWLRRQWDRRAAHTRCCGNSDGQQDSPRNDGHDSSSVNRAP